MKNQFYNNRYKTIILSLVCILVTGNALAQTDYNQQVELFSKDLAKKIPHEGYNVAVIDFKNSLSQVTQLTKQFAEDLSDELSNLSNENKFDVVNRLKMDAVVKDMKLSERKDENKIMFELAKKSIAKIFISGNIILFGDNYRVDIKIINEDNKVLGSLKGLIVKTSALEALEKVVIETGFTTTSAPMETKSKDDAATNSQETPCDNNLGDYCFKNTSRSEITIDLFEKKTDLRRARQSLGTITIEPNEIGCFYDITADSYIIRYKSDDVMESGPPNKTKSIRVEKCKKNPKPENIRVPHGEQAHF